MTYLAVWITGKSCTPDHHHRDFVRLIHRRKGCGEGSSWLAVENEELEIYRNSVLSE